MKSPNTLPTFCFRGSQNADAIRALTRKLAPPLVTLLNSEPEIQYVALRNINLIVQKRPHILENEIKVFFCKYNDPIYVKMEKLEIIIKLVTERNIDQVLLELKEYSTEVDVDFVRKAVSAIGRCAVKLERAAERCIGVLLELIQTKVNYVVQESVIIKNIFRRYPGRYVGVVVCDASCVEHYWRVLVSKVLYFLTQPLSSQL
jgi:AP-1 complex subunit beta-1